MKKEKTSILSYISAIAVVAFFLFLSYSRAFDEFENSTLDFRYSLRPVQPVDKDIVIIHIGDDTIDQLGEWPIPRRYHALLIKALKQAGARSIIMDVFFSEDNPDDEDLSKTIKEAGNVYLPYVFDLESRKTTKDRYPHALKYLAPLVPELKSAAKNTGFINVEPDTDGKVREIIPFVKYEDRFYPHITFLAALDTLGIPFDGLEIVPGNFIRLDRGRKIPIEEDSSMLVNYPGKWDKTFRHYSYVDVLQSYLSDSGGQKPMIDMKELKGSVCFVGFTAAASPDAHPSPLESLYPGVGVHASLYNSMMHNSFLTRLDRVSNLIVLAVLWVLTGFVTMKTHRKYAFLYVMGIITAYVAMTVLIFDLAGIWMDIFYPLVSIMGIYGVFTFKRYIAETKRRELLEKELDIAKDIQQSFLPLEIPQVGALDIAVKMKTARQVGGDLYDVVELNGGRVGVMIGDVSGKGVPAALFMAKAVSVFKTFVKEFGCKEVVRNMNDRLVAENNSSLFVTVTYMIFDPEKKTLDFSIGGHMPTVRIKRSGDVELLEVEEGTPLGLMEGEFGGGMIKYEEGDLYLLYTDGASEAMNIRNEMYEEERLIELAKSLRERTAQEVVDTIHKRLAEFAGKADQHDDITVIAIRT